MKQFFLVGDPHEAHDPSLWLVAVEDAKPGAAIPIPKAVAAPILGLFQRALDPNEVNPSEAQSIIDSGQRLIDLAGTGVSLDRIKAVALATDRMKDPVMTRRSAGLLTPDGPLAKHEDLLRMLLEVGFLNLAP